MAKMLDESGVVSAAPSDQTALQQLQAMLAAGQPPQVVGADGAAMTMPPPIVQVLQRALTILESGAQVQVVPLSELLTPADAAVLLNVPSAYIAQLIQDGVLQPNTEGYLRRSDVIAYTREQEARTHAALDEMVRLSEEMGLYDVPFTAEGQVVPSTQGAPQDTHG